jgi:hypothetical protein
MKKAKRVPKRAKRNGNQIVPRSVRSVQSYNQVTYNSTHVQAFPDRYVTTLVYEDTESITSTNNYASYIYRGNSVYDPDYSGAGHQPTGFDNLAALYARYRVLSSDIVVSALNNIGTTPAVAVIVPNTEILTYTNANEFKESLRARKTTAIPVAGYGTRTVRHRCSSGAILGLNMTETFNEGTASAINTNPAHIWYWNVVAVNMLTVGVNLTIDVRIKYRVEFFDKINPGLSSRSDYEQLSKSERHALTHLDLKDSPGVQPLQVEVADQPISVVLASLSTHPLSEPHDKSEEDRDNMSGQPYVSVSGGPHKPSSFRERFSPLRGEGHLSCAHKNQGPRQK